MDDLAGTFSDRNTFIHKTEIYLVNYQNPGIWLEKPIKERSLCITTLWHNACAVTWINQNSETTKMKQSFD
jgi:hypothetical protein